MWDVYNNVSEKTIYFNVVKGLAPEIADVYCTGNPASVETSFYVKHNRPDAVVTVTIEVYDLMGRMVWSSKQAGRRARTSRLARARTSSLTSTVW